MATYNSTIHIHQDMDVKVTANANVYPDYETNWLSIKIGRSDWTIFFRSLQDMAELAAKLNFAVDQEIRRRFNDEERPSVIDELVGDDA